MDDRHCKQWVYNQEVWGWQIQNTLRQDREVMWQWWLSYAAEKQCSTNYMWMSGRSWAWIAVEKKHGGVAFRSSAEVAEGVIHVSVRAKASMLRVSARSAIAVYLRGLRRERILCMHTLKVVEVGPGLSWMAPALVRVFPIRRIPSLLEFSLELVL